MRGITFLAAAAAAFASFPAVAAPGQTGDKPAAPLPAGHSAHGEVFNEGPRQQAYLMGGTGNVHLTVTSRVPRAQQFFDQGLGQLHGFWYFEAERSFRQVAALDPACAMAYWGMAMANIENTKRAQGFIRKANEHKKNAGRREQLWIDGLSDYLTGSGDRKQRRQRYLRSLETILHEFPDEIEAKAFLAVRLWQFKSDLPLPSLLAVDALLDQVFAANPMHPAHHYRIHLWDDSKPQRALGSAARCGQSSPRIAHMWHMPGHTYAHLHRYADAAWQQEASSRADHAAMMRDRVLPDQIHNYAHNQEWLCRDLSHIGRSRDAAALARNLIELPRHPRYNKPGQPGRSSSFGRQRLFEVLERYELWDELIALCGSTYLEPTDLPAEQIKRLRALGLAHAGRGDRAGLAAQIAELEKRLPHNEPAPAAKTGKTPAAGKGKQAAKAPPAKRKGRNAGNDVENALLELRAALAVLDGNPKAALEGLKKVTGLNKTRLARAHLLAGDRTKAEQLARQAADGAPNEVVPLAGYVEVLFGCGKTKEAGEAFARLRKISGHIDNLDAPVFKRLEPAARALHLPADWRVPAVPATDVGNRPSLDSIGPFRWQPAPAPAWSLPDADGKTVALSQLHGRPVVVLFYLGYGCLHCVEQLNTFAPKAKEFADAGIAVVAISTDAVPDLKKATVKYRAGSEFPFPLLSDARLEVFKQYRAHDDFENKPLHGTFLIDAQGRVRWQDVSYEPFTDAAFLLREAKRLLALPAGEANLIPQGK